MTLYLITYTIKNDKERGGMAMVTASTPQQASKILEIQGMYSAFGYNIHDITPIPGAGIGASNTVLKEVVAALGEPGKDGADGTSVTHHWEGTTLVIHSSSGVTRTNLKGEKGNTGEKGERGERGLTGDRGPVGPEGPMGPEGHVGPKGEQGPQGPRGYAGEDGYTPRKGIDYFDGEKGEPFRFEDFTPEQIEALRGPRGLQGEPGPMGPQGPRGSYSFDGPVATTTEVGLCKPDGNSIAIDSEGTLKIPTAYDYVIYSIQYGGGESGYRKWRNGRLEQWGVATTNAAETEFNLHQPFKDQNFSIYATVRAQGNYYIYAIPSATQKMKIRIADQWSTPQAIKFQWKAEGYWK